MSRLGLCFLIVSLNLFSQNDSIFLMNGLEFEAQVSDSSSEKIMITDLKKHGKTFSFEAEQIFKVRYASGFERYYYTQDSLNNWMSRDEVGFFRKGEADAREGFKGRGALIGSLLVGIASGSTGSFWSPIAPFIFMALTGVPKVKINVREIENKENLKSDAYLMGYERVARQKMKTRSVIGGAAGLIVGIAIYASFNQYYPEDLHIGFNR